MIRLYSRDEELGKRDDDFRPQPSPMSASLLPWRWRRKRLLLAILALVLLYVVLRNTSNDMVSWSQRSGNPLPPAAEAPQSASLIEPTGAPPLPSGFPEDETSTHYFDGSLKFYRLAVSLQNVKQGTKVQNRNILFGASSLRSAANLIPMACEMARWDRNYVHFALLGRDPLPMDDILEINGVRTEDCAVTFHDGRSDYSKYSTDRRAEISVGGALQHINRFMHPQAIIMDDSAIEDGFFTRAMRSKAKEIGRPLIEVPAGQYKEFLWMTRLDSGSLSNWFKPNIEILVHALPDSSGSIIRLIRSLERADYTGLKVPRLTVELPNDVEVFAKRHLERLTWPPVDDDASPVRQSTLSLRHRIRSARSGEAEASIRFLESFYPVSTSDHHVLVLSPQAEVHPLFLQYLHYAILEYKYSSYRSGVPENLLGLSIDIPTTHLNGTGKFIPPNIADMKVTTLSDAQSQQQNLPSSFLYQAPSATANLIFGDKWAALHNFLTNRLKASRSKKVKKTAKLVAETEPAWLEYLLELMRSRGWNTLHPSVSLVTLHNELSQIPEEYLREPPDEPPDADNVKSTDHRDEQTFLTAADPPKLVENMERQQPEIQALHEILPLDGDLPELPHLPLISYTGDLIESNVATEMQTAYVLTFRSTIGGCEGTDATRPRVIQEGKTDDLFCLPDAEIRFADEEANGGEKLAKNSPPASERQAEQQPRVESGDVSGSAAAPAATTLTGHEAPAKAASAKNTDNHSIVERTLGSENGMTAMSASTSIAVVAHRSEGGVTLDTQH